MFTMRLWRSQGPDTTQIGKQHKINKSELQISEDARPHTTLRDKMYRGTLPKSIIEYVTSWKKLTMYNIMHRHSLRYDILQAINIFPWKTQTIHKFAKIQVYYAKSWNYIKKWAYYLVQYWMIVIKARRYDNQPTHQILEKRVVIPFVVIQE